MHLFHLVNTHLRAVSSQVMNANQLIARATKGAKGFCCHGNLRGHEASGVCELEFKNRTKMPIEQTGCATLKHKCFVSKAMSHHSLSCVPGVGRRYVESFKSNGMESIEKLEEKLKVLGEEGFKDYMKNTFGVNILHANMIVCGLIARKSNNAKREKVEPPTVKKEKGFWN